MLALYIIGFIIISILVTYIGLQLSSNITDNILYILFWFLYIIVCISLGNIVAIANFWSVVEKKTGPPGPRGPEGDHGMTGPKGKCGDKCRNKVCSYSLQETIENTLKDLTSSDTAPIITNKMILNKIGQICNSKEYEIVAPMKGPNNLIEYLSENWKTWTTLIFNSGGLSFFTNIDAEDDYAWKNGTNPFIEIGKYDVWNWGLTRDFVPLAVEICDDPSKSNQFPQPDKEPTIKYGITNSYTMQWNDKNTGANDNISVWYPNIIDYENERYYPVGQTAVAPSRREENGRAPKQFEIDGITIPIAGSGPDVKTILVAGDVVGPYDYVWRWDSTNAKFGKYPRSAWMPLPPEGYVCLGDLIIQGMNKPPTGDAAPIRCIPKKYAKSLQGIYGVNHIYQSQGDKGAYDMAVYTVLPRIYDKRVRDYGTLNVLEGFSLFRVYPFFKRFKGFQNLPMSAYGSHPFYTLVGVPSNSAQQKIIQTNSTERSHDVLGIGWHGTPSREPKYSIFTFLGLMPESIITLKSTGRKFYMYHTSEYYHDDTKNTSIPVNSYIVKVYDDKTKSFDAALYSSGNDVKLSPVNKADVRQYWEVEFIADTSEDFRLKSRDTGMYLFIKPTKNLRGRSLYTQLSSTAINNPDYQPYITFSNNKSAFGSSINLVRNNKKNIPIAEDTIQPPPPYRFITGISG